MWLDLLHIWWSLVDFISSSCPLNYNTTQIGKLPSREALILHFLAYKPRLLEPPDAPSSVGKSQALLCHCMPSKTEYPHSSVIVGKPSERPILLGVCPVTAPDHTCLFFFPLWGEQLKTSHSCKTNYTSWKVFYVVYSWTAVRMVYQYT